MNIWKLKFVLNFVIFYFFIFWNVFQILIGRYLPNNIFWKFSENFFPNFCPKMKNLFTLVEIIFQIF